MRMKAVFTMFRLALLIPEWVWGRKVILDLCLMYLIINAMAGKCNV